jgi:response regulator RpfG family c-di-GMP phosphodiesterase
MATDWMAQLAVPVADEPSSENVAMNSTQDDHLSLEHSKPVASANLGDSEAIPAKGFSAHMPMSNAPAPDLTVLVLERERGMREIIKEGLDNARFHPIFALTAKHAAWICRNHGGLIDLLLIDVTALGQRPLDCVQTIKEPQPDLPVLLISAYDRQTLCEQHPELLTTYEFLPVPFEFSHLTETIETLLQFHSTPKDKRQTKGA